MNGRIWVVMERDVWPRWTLALNKSATLQERENKVRGKVY